MQRDAKLVVTKAKPAFITASNRKEGFALLLQIFHALLHVQVIENFQTLPHVPLHLATSAYFYYYGLFR